MDIFSDAKGTREGAFARIIATADEPWQPSGADGFSMKELFKDEGKGCSTWLMKVEAGAHVEAHAHDEVEQIYVIEGSFYDQEKEHKPGDFILRLPGQMHTSGSRDGALVFLVYTPAG